VWRASWKATAAVPPCSVAEGQAYSALERGVAAALTALAAGSLPALLLAVVLSTDPPITPELLFVLFGAFVVVPMAVVVWIRHSTAVGVQVDGLTLALARRRLRLEVPCDAIEEIMPWRVPLPGPGLSLRMRSGRRLRYGLALSDPLPVLEALRNAGGVEAAARVIDHPAVVYAAARSAHRKGWPHLIAKFGVFSLFPTAILFNAHQHISYGGPLGQYYMLGLRPYLTTLAIYWATTLIYLILYASVWRGVAETVSLAAAWFAGAYAVRTRRIAEMACAVGYYGGVPLLLLIRFLP
jgi:hypothetical protein